MKLNAVYYCDVCSAEIPAGEETNEFSTTLLAQKGHCHSECLTQRNAILRQYDETVAALTALLDPGVPSAQKIAQASIVEGKRNQQLKRVPSKGPPQPKALPRGVRVHGRKKRGT